VRGQSGNWLSYRNGGSCSLNSAKFQYRFGDLKMFVTVGNAKIYSTAFGSITSPVIVGIGGWIGSWELWAEPFAILSHNWRTIAYDHRGAGATIAPVESITFDRLVDDVFAVLDA
jgi:pimeloyl-ACP methyl ester carboxylesterase